VSTAARRVLLIEDHDDNRKILAALLRRAGFSVTAYGSCEPAQRHLEACDVDVALLDVRMADRAGDDFGRELRARCGGQRITAKCIAGAQRIAGAKRDTRRRRRRRRRRQRRTGATG
jgi:CheY-like chemotaxis protein